MTPEQAAAFQRRFEVLVDNVAAFIQGKRPAIELALVCLLAEGHLLIEDVPGVGKTSLARSIAASMGTDWQRIQFTPDLLPSDVTGVTVYHQNSGTFQFHPGPLFASLVLADEINRASPRTQSALLEVMEERTVTVDGVTHAVPRPFMVIATQNPIEMDGTYPLPEAQLDRFLMKISVGYPDLAAEARVLANMHAGHRLEDLPAVTTSQEVLAMVSLAASVGVAPVVQDYIVRLVAVTRGMPDIRLGASPRGSVGILRAARVRAASQGRTTVHVADVQTLAEPVLAHRLLLAPEAELAGRTQAAAITAAVNAVPAPQG